METRRPAPTLTPPCSCPRGQMERPSSPCLRPVLSPLGAGPPATCTLCWGPFPLTSPTGSTLAWDTYLCSPSLPPLVFSLPLLSRRKK